MRAASFTAPVASPRPKGRVLLSARWVVGHRSGRHCLIENGQVVFEDGEVIFVGRDFPALSLTGVTSATP